jgi:chorismate lyase/3-hydroxybenzoate synthase
VQALLSGPLVLLTTSVLGARGLPSDALRARIAEAYVGIGDALTSFGRQPIRFWNFIPDPVEIMDGGLNRYMIFNAGRHEGYARWSVRLREPGPSLPTASAMGIIGDDLVIHCLASDTAGTPVENPRQQPAWRYSPRYGPVPPCFSRATIATVGTRLLLLIGGTASIVGEDSLHNDDVGAQLEETLKNVEALIVAAAGGPPAEAALSYLTDVRACVARAEEAPMIRSVLAARCARDARVEVTIARFCRRELLLEIEGVAELDGGGKG